MPITLDISAGGKSWTQTISDGVTVKAGRSKNADIHIPDRTVSGLHFQLRNIPGGWVLKDLQSTNGTIVNDEKISDVALQEGDVIKAGNCIIVFHCGLMQSDKSTETDSRKPSHQAETVAEDEPE